MINTIKKHKTLLILTLAMVSFAFAPVAEKLIDKNGHVKFHSHTAVEDITANNYKAVSSINTTTGDVVFSIPMQSFEFEKAAMQKHYNSPKFLDTKKYPKAKLVAKITNLSDIDFNKDGTYNTTVKGKLTLHGVTKEVEEEGTITVKAASVKLKSEMEIILSDYNVVFVKGKPSTNIAKSVTVTTHSEYTNE